MCVTDRQVCVCERERVCVFVCVFVSEMMLDMQTCQSTERSTDKIGQDYTNKV